MPYDPAVAEAREDESSQQHLRPMGKKRIAERRASSVQIGATKEEMEAQMLVRKLNKDKRLREKNIKEMIE